MKKILLTVFIGIIFLLTGCWDEEEGYSLSKMWVGFGVLQEQEDNTARIVMDNHDILIPVASNHNHAWNMDRHDDDAKPVLNGDRLLVNYTIIGDDVDNNGNVIGYFVKLNSTKKILMKNILDITAENQDSIGNDPVIVKDCWQTDSLLNFKIRYWGRDEIHFINLVKEPDGLSASDQPIELELRHNKNNDAEDIPYAAYVSFKLRELEIAGLDSVKYVVRATDYEGDIFTYEGTHHYGNN